jgi:hypothetical protein
VCSFKGRRAAVAVPNKLSGDVGTTVPICLSPSHAAGHKADLQKNTTPSAQLGSFPPGRLVHRPTTRSEQHKRGVRSHAYERMKVANCQ